jgi:serine/threonine protein kinase
MPTDAEILAALNGLGKFTILDENREGANAHAFRAFHSHLQRQVFLKVFYLGTEETELTLREPRLLVQATQSNGCDNIVRVFDGDVLTIGGDDYVCLQMEYVEGGSLLARLQEGDIGQQDAVRTATQVLQGVQQLHHLRFVHRDLKPGNILISTAGVAKITDFGSVARIPEATDYCTASRHSILYVPPEAMDGRYRFVSDLYQVGMVLYEMVNGPMKYGYAHYVLPKAQRQRREHDKRISAGTMSRSGVQCSAPPGRAWAGRRQKPSAIPSERMRRVSPPTSSRLTSLRSFRLPLPFRLLIRPRIAAQLGLSGIGLECRLHRRHSPLDNGSLGPSRFQTAVRHERSRDRGRVPLRESACWRGWKFSYPK